MNLSRDAHERKIFERALTLPDRPEPYDLGQPFNADTLMAGFTEEEHVIYAEPETPLGELAA